MKIAPLVALGGTAVVALVVCAAPASGQMTRPDRSYQGLFGGRAAAPQSGQSLGVNGSLFGAYDSNVLAAQQSGGVDPRYQQSGGYGGATLSLDYRRRVGRSTLDFTGGSSYRYYPSYKAMNGASVFLSMGLTTQVTPHTTLRATESAAYTPYYALGALPGAPPANTGDVGPINPDYPLLQRSIVSLYSSAALDHDFTSRTALGLDYTVGYTDHRHTPLDFYNWSAGSNYRYRVSRRTTAHLGYHYRTGDYPDVAGGRRSDRTHEITFGMDNARLLSPSRSMTMGFTVGTSLYSTLTPFELTPGNSFYLRNHVLVNGHAYVTRQFGRSWSGTVSYDRGLQYVQGFSTPFFSDSASGTVTGYLNAKTMVHFGGAYSSGQIRPAGTGQGYSTYSGQVGGQLAVSRYLAAFADYNYYHYRFDDSVALPAGINRGLNRQSVRVGMNIWLPLMR